MPKINTYAVDGTVTNNDKVIGTDTASGETKNYLVSDIVALASGGGGGVTAFTSTAGTFVNVTTNAAATGSVSVGTVDLSATGTAGATTFLRGDNTWSTIGGGDVVGPASSVDLSIPVFDGTTGKLLKDATGVTIDVSGNVTSGGDVEGATITKTGGTSSQFLKADGTVDSGTYLLNVVEDTSPELGGNLDANTNNVTGAGKFQGDQFQSILNTLAASAAVTFNTLNGVYAELTIAQNCTLDVRNLGVGTPAILKVTQDASTPYTISSYTVEGGPTVVKWPSGTVPTITATPLSAVDIITFISDGTNIYGSIVQDFS